MTQLNIAPAPDADNARLVFADFVVNSAFQPVVSLTHRRVVGYEALARPSRNGKAVSPGELFAAAAREELIPALDLSLWQQHLQRFATQETAVWLFLNLSSSFINETDMSPEYLAERVYQVGMRCDQIVLEVVEDEIASDDILVDFVTRSKALGFRIAVDDFGAGDAHFERVWRLEPFIVKMDRRMVVHAAENPAARKLFISLVRLIRENGSLVLVEGIESRQQADVALLSEADLYQGFFFAHPSALMDGRESTEKALEELQRQYDQARFLESHNHQDLLKLLRYEVLAACHRLAREDPLADISNSLLEITGVARCFMLNSQGIQQGKAASKRDFTEAGGGFNPLCQSQGASWSHREYFLRATENPSQINISRPYMALPDSVRTVTLSVLTYTGAGNRVFCVDIHPDEAFPGMLELPSSL